ncbi:hypothetical protein ACUOBA_45840, partial [Escherichia coli]
AAKTMAATTVNLFIDSGLLQECQQEPDIVETLITLPETQLKEYFTKYVLDSDE